MLPVLQTRKRSGARWGLADRRWQGRLQGAAQKGWPVVFTPQCTLALLPLASVQTDQPVKLLKILYSG